MKYTILINQHAIADAGFAHSTDLCDWALLEYIHSWHASGNGRMQDGHVWLNYSYLIEQMPLLNLNTKSAVSNRVTKLRKLGLITTLQDRTKRLFVACTDKYSSATQFSGQIQETAGGVHEHEHSDDNPLIGREAQSGVHENEQGVHKHEHFARKPLTERQSGRVHENERGVHEHEHSFYKQDSNNPPNTRAKQKIESAEIVSLACWTITQPIRDWAARKQMTVDLEDELEKFRDWHLSRKTKLKDIEAGFRVWLRKAQEFKDDRPPPRGNHETNRGTHPHRTTRREHSERIGSAIDAQLQKHFGAKMGGRLV